MRKCEEVRECVIEKHTHTNLTQRQGKRENRNIVRSRAKERYNRASERETDRQLGKREDRCQNMRKGNESKKEPQAREMELGWVKWQIERKKEKKMHLKQEHFHKRKDYSSSLVECVYCQWEVTREDLCLTGLLSSWCLFLQCMLHAHTLFTLIIL